MIMLVMTMCYNGLVLPVDDISRGGGVFMMGRTYELFSRIRVEGQKDPHAAGNTRDGGSPNENTGGGNTTSASNAGGQGEGGNMEGEKLKGSKTRAYLGAHRERQIQVTLNSKAGDGNHKAAGPGSSTEEVQPTEA